MPSERFKIVPDKLFDLLLIEIRTRMQPRERNEIFVMKFKERHFTNLLGLESCYHLGGETLVLVYSRYDGCLLFVGRVIILHKQVLNPAV